MAVGVAQPHANPCDPGTVIDARLGACMVTVNKAFPDLDTTGSSCTFTMMAPKINAYTGLRFTPTTTAYSPPMHALQYLASNATVRDTPTGRGLFANAVASVGEAILELDGEILSTPSVFSVQVGAREHLHPNHTALAADDTERSRWRFLNHSCDPNCWMDGRTLRARRAIAAGEQLTFDYNCTEWSMDVPFDCACGACNGLQVRGYAHLDAEARTRRDAHAAPHLRARAMHGHA